MTTEGDDVLASLEAPPPTKPDLDELLGSRTLLDYHDAADVVGLQPQSLRVALKRRYAHMAADAEAKGLPQFQLDPETGEPLVEQATGKRFRNGEAHPDDIPEPDRWRNREPRAEPRWYEGSFRAWARRVGLLAEDAVTVQKRKPKGRTPGSKSKPRS